MPPPISLVFLPGTGCQKDSVTFLGHLQNMYPTYVFNLPGHGGESVEGIRNVGNMADRIHQHISELGIQNYVLVGFSLGGMVALRFAERYPNDQNLKGVVAWATPLEHGKQYFSKALRFVIWILDTFPSNVLYWILNNFPVLNIMRFFELNFAYTNMRDFRHVIQLLRDEPKINLETTTPKLLLFGSKDITIGNKDYQHVLEHQPPFCEIHVYEGAGHAGTKKGRRTGLLAIHRWLQKLEQDELG